MDWIPRIFPSLTFLVSRGWHIAVHLSLVPVTLTRRCHMARFLGETHPERCSRPCLQRALVLRNEILEEFNLELVLHGNAVFRLEPPSRERVKELELVGAGELVLTMNPVTRVVNADDIRGVMGALLPDRSLR
jgi:hypothetical protein